MHSQKDYKIIYYKDNGTLPPEYHEELVIKIYSNGLIKIKKLKGYEDQIQFQHLLNLNTNEMLLFRHYLEKIELSKSYQINAPSKKMGSPTEYIEIFYHKNIIKWYYPDIFKEHDKIFLEMHNLIKQTIKNHLNENLF